MNPKRKWLGAVVLALSAIFASAVLWVLTLEHHRRESLFVLEQNYATCENWRVPPLSRPLTVRTAGGAMDSWLSYPNVISTEPSHLVSSADLGLAIRRLRPRELLMNGAGSMDLALLRHLSHTSSIHTLELAEADINDESIAYIAKMKGLEQLQVTGTSITGKSLDDLGKSSSLRVLCIGGTDITKAEAQEFAKQHPGIRVVR